MLTEEEKARLLKSFGRDSDDKFTEVALEIVDSRLLESDREKVFYEITLMVLGRMEDKINKVLSQEK